MCSLTAETYTKVDRRTVEMAQRCHVLRALFMTQLGVIRASTLESRELRASTFIDCAKEPTKESRKHDGSVEMLKGNCLFNKKLKKFLVMLDHLF